LLRRLPETPRLRDTLSLIKMGRTTMPVIQCDIREGWSDEQKRALASRLTKVVADVEKVPVSVHIVIREARGLRVMFGG
jgi:phenylpyruvate tautomerase PptA (4-oxalocrotonate tautomerase family)